MSDTATPETDVETTDTLSFDQLVSNVLDTGDSQRVRFHFGGHNWWADLKTGSFTSAQLDAISALDADDPSSADSAHGVDVICSFLADKVRKTSLPLEFDYDTLKTVDVAVLLILLHAITNGATAGKDHKAKAKKGAKKG